jgi:hypothetical protein
MLNDLRYAPTALAHYGVRVPGGKRGKHRVHLLLGAIELREEIENAGVQRVSHGE